MRDSMKRLWYRWYTKKNNYYFKIEIPPKRSTTAHVTLLGLATEENKQVEGNVNN